MCGICGEISFTGESNFPEKISRMTNTLWRRGPDASGIFVAGHIGLGHRRLKIIDLSEASQQPMVDSELGLAVVYNGAIYNYRELREELCNLGYRFFSNGDTEVILKAYHAWGESFIERLFGMFAFAISERDTGRLLLARDRLGIKPLYYSRSEKFFRFASTPQAILAGGDIDTDIDPVALHHYMTFHAVVPPPRTILNGVKKLYPSTLMIIDNDGNIVSKNYWKCEIAESLPLSKTFADCSAEVMDSLRRSVKRRLVADVPVGVLLSGGLDSSLIVGLLAEAGQTDINTFSIGFDSVNGEEGNEFIYSDIIANHFSTKHHRINISSEHLMNILPECVESMSEPMVSHDAIGFYLLSKVVASHLKVVQSGQGADEVFAGYHWYPPMMNSENALNDYARFFFDRDHSEFSKAVNPLFLGSNYSIDFVKRFFAELGTASPVDKALAIDTNIMLVDDPVKRVDNMTMAWGLEARVPFLDHEVVEVAAKVPAEYKVKNGGKHILKESARKIIPSAVIDRPKGYFPVPALKYIKGDYLDFARDVLESSTAKKRALFQSDYIAMLLKNPTTQITPLNGSKLWQCVLLEFWLQLNDI